MRFPLCGVGSALAIVSALGCSDSAAGPNASEKPSSPVVSAPAPIIVRLAIAPDSAVMTLASEMSFTAYTVMSDSSRVPVRPDYWYSSDQGVLAVNGAIGKAVAVGPGQVAVLAGLDKLRAFAFVTVPPPKGGGTSDALVIESYSLIEYQDPSGIWVYAPQMRARAASGRKVTVLVLRFVVPDLGNLIPFGCGGNLTDAPRDLFGEVYGDWLLEVGGSNQPIRNPGTVTVTFIDDAGLTGTRVVSGQVVRGGGPATYSGGQNGGACFHGYGSIE